MVTHSPRRQRPNKTLRAPKRPRQQTLWQKLQQLPWRRMCHIGAIAAFWGAVVLLAGILYLSWQLPDLAEAVALDKQPSIVMLDANNQEIARYGDQQGDILAVKDMSPYLVQAVVAIEDRRFYSHWGIDPWGILRAVFTNMVHRGLRQGGSTITQQLAKNLFLTPERSLKRKAKEALLALYLDYKYNKDTLLAAYLNRAYFGAGAYGVDAAAQIYFSTSARNLSLPQAAMLAGLLKAPSTYSPFNNPALAAKRTQVVLQAMIDAEKITAQAAQVKIPLLQKNNNTRSGTGDMRYFTDWVLQQLPAFVGERQESLVVKTTLIKAEQAAASQNLRNALNTHAVAKQVGQGAVLLMTHQGAITAMVGGRDYFASNYNRATQAKRQAGSAFKPIIYLAALEAGYTPDQWVEDKPIKINGYAPTNYDGRFRGNMSLTMALADSINTVAVQLLHDVGINATKRMARRLGLTANLPSDLTLALGTADVSLFELTTAYATIANGGNAPQPFGIAEIKTAKGQTLYKHSLGGFVQVLSPQTTSDITRMLQAVVQYGTGKAAILSPWAVAGKTGTSQNYRDALFVGFTAQRVGAVWLGNDQNKPMNKVTGGGLPAQIWQQTMQVAQANQPALPLFNIPSVTLEPSGDINWQQDSQDPQAIAPTETPVAGTLPADTSFDQLIQNITDTEEQEQQHAPN